MSPAERVAAMVLAFMLAGGSLVGAAGKPAIRLFPTAVEADRPDRSAEAEAFGDALRDALATNLEREGFRVLEEAAKPSISLLAPSDLARDAWRSGAGWAAQAQLALEGSRIAYIVSIYDARSEALIAAEAFSTFAGIGALPLMEEGSRLAAAKAAAYRDTVGETGGDAGSRLVPYRILLKSSDEGASICVGDPRGGRALAVGRIEKGALLLPYIALEKGSRIVIGIESSGKRTAVVEALLGDETPILVAAPLEKLEKQAMYVDSGPGRLLGLGLGYRFYLIPDWTFVFVDVRAFAGYDFRPSSSPILHSEIWQGIGTFVVTPPGFLVRTGLCVGAGTLFSSSAAAGESDRIIGDFALLPLEAFAEVRVLDGFSVRFSARSAYSLGLDSGILARGWMGGSLPLLFSCGLTWRF